MRRAFLGCFLPVVFVAVVAAAFVIADFAFNGGRSFNSLEVLILRLQLGERQDELRAPFRADTSKTRFHIPLGTGAASIAANLQAADLIGDPQLFLDYARVEGLDRRFEAGTYCLTPAQSISQIARALSDSGSSVMLFRTPEGSRIEEIAELIDSADCLGFSGADFLQLVGPGAPIPAAFAQWAGIPPGASLEGYLYPDTYQIALDTRVEDLRGRLLAAFRERVGDQLQQEALALGATLHQMVTLASIIEREAVWPDEHAMIASVYRNRLAIGMRLEADPTVQYGLQGQRGSWWPSITRSDYREAASPYNTYLHNGLPPGPIASPSASAIQAAIHPAESIYLFFRAACDNSFTHNFAVTFEEHLANGC